MLFGCAVGGAVGGLTWGWLRDFPFIEIGKLMIIGACAYTAAEYSITMSDQTWKRGLSFGLVGGTVLVILKALMFPIYGGALKQLPPFIGAVVGGMVFAYLRDRWQ